MATKRRHNLAGKRFGRWYVLCESENDRNERREVFWHCICDCGVTRDVKAGSLTQGKSISCGCARLESVVTHGMTHTPTFKSWESMKQRCLNAGSADYPRYGGRGISVHAPWIDSFDTFFRDMGQRPKGTSLDRIDVNGDYTPSNCQWSTRSKQQRNKSNQVQVTAFGKTQTAGIWELETGVPSKVILWRVAHGWSPENAVSVPKRNKS